MEVSEHWVFENGLLLEHDTSWTCVYCEDSVATEIFYRVYVDGHRVRSIPNYMVANNKALTSTEFSCTVMGVF